MTFMALDSGFYEIFIEEIPYFVRLSTPWGSKYITSGIFIPKPGPVED